MAIAESTSSRPEAAATGPRRRPPRGDSRDGRRFRPGRVLSLLGLALVGFLALYPLLWLVSASIKPRRDVFDNRLIPEQLSPENYTRVWDEMPLLQWLGNSVVVGLAASVAVVISSALVAFGFAYFRFRGRDALFVIVLSTMMLPAVVTLIPTYLIWDSVGLAQTQVPLWAGNLFGSAFYIFLLRQFFLGLPRELFDAALVDGCSYFGLFRRIALPLSRPALLMTFLFEFQASWADLMRPLVYLRDPALFTLPRGLKAVLDQFGQGGEREWELVLAANVIATLPMLLVLIVAGRYLTSGMQLTYKD
jgi:multiple sugar transport system permease protein